MKNDIRIPAYMLLGVGLFCILFGVVVPGYDWIPEVIGLVLIVISVILLSGQKITKIGIHDVFSIETAAASQIHEPPRKLDDEEMVQRRNFSSRIIDELPGENAPAFNVLEEKMAVTVTPCSDPMTPMYMLDNYFRIIDWNASFSACFDRTMEGRRGLTVLEWTYFLENYKEILEHGKKVFGGDAKEFPRIDVEELHYNSRRFGHIKGIKRAYQVPNDDGSCLGWLITIEPEFESIQMSQAFQASLFSSLRLSLMWSEYALSYDMVLNQSNIYPELLRKLLGETGSGLSPIPQKAKVLDLGAGTGNITFMLANPGSERLVVALDNNNMMLNYLRNKCSRVLRKDAFRISEPHKNANAEKVLSVIKKELQKNGRFEAIKNHYYKVEQINKYSLAPMLNKINLTDMEQILQSAGFSEIIYREDKTYAKQSFIVCARKS
ncbi:MAG: class I SAM-dependent methyltransferase [Thiotrichaceae bacterium]|nr:class I SAM-dependent methyltransferase [Thiotrichaceae bacterium]